MKIELNSLKAAEAAPPSAPPAVNGGDGKGKRQSDLFSELVELRAKLQLLQSKGLSPPE